MTLDLSCTDWKERLRSGQSLIPTLQLPGSAEGDRAVAIFNKLRLYDVPGTPTMADAGGEWFRQIVWALFASLDPVTKARLIKEIFLLVPKKQNKTTGGALLMLTALTMNQRPRAPFLMTAPFQKQANEAFSAAAGAIALDPVLDKMFHVRDHVKTIIHRQTKANLEILTFDPGMVTGKKVAGGLIDELHVLGKMPRANKAMLQLRGGMLPFPEAFLVTITTQSDEAPSGVFLEDLTRAREIRDGKRQGNTLPVLYEFPEEMQTDRNKPWRDRKFWYMVTPNLGRPMSLEAMEASFRDEEAKGEAALRIWASQHLNVQIGVAIRSDGWAGAEFWDNQRNIDSTLTFDTLLDRCEVVVLGIDGGGLDDLLGLAALGRERETGKWLLWTHAWAHKIVLERRQSIASKLHQFVEEGSLTLVDEPGDDVADVASYVFRVRDAGLLPEKNGVGVDQNGIIDIVEALMTPEDGLQDGELIGISQGWKLTSAIKTGERRVASGDIVHNGSQLMAWCAGNAKGELRGNALLITKALSGTGKIDPLMAMFDAIALMSLNPEASGGTSFWEKKAA